MLWLGGKNQRRKPCQTSSGGRRDGFMSLVPDQNKLTRLSGTGLNQRRGGTSRRPHGPSSFRVTRREQQGYGFTPCLRPGRH